MVARLGYFGFNQVRWEIKLQGHYHITNSSTGLRNVCTFPAKTRSKVANITTPVSWALGSKSREIMIEAIIIGLIVAAIIQGLGSGDALDALNVLFVIATALIVLVGILVLLLFFSQWWGWIGFAISIPLIFLFICFIDSMDASMVITLFSIILAIPFLVLNGYVAHHDNILFFMETID